MVAADRWGDQMQRMRLPSARRGNVEALLHNSLTETSALLVFPPTPTGWLAEERPHRTVGVVYHPGAERWGNHVPTVLGRRYDAFRCDESRG